MEDLTYYKYINIDNKQICVVKGYQLHCDRWEISDGKHIQVKHEDLSFMNTKFSLG